MPLGAVHPIIASEAKQSIVRLSKKLDCFAALAMTAVGQSHTSAFSRRECARVVHGFPPFPWEGRGECRVPTHPQPRMQSKKAYELVTTGKAGLPGIPARNGFNGFLRDLPGDRALLSPSLCASERRA